MVPPQPSCPDSPGKSCHVGTLSRLDLFTRNARSPCGVLWGHMPGPSATPAWFLCTPKAFRTSTGSTVERQQGEEVWSELAQESGLTAQPRPESTQKAEQEDLHLLGQSVQGHTEQMRLCLKVGMKANKQNSQLQKTWSEFGGSLLPQVQGAAGSPGPAALPPLPHRCYGYISLLTLVIFFFS